MSDDKKVIQDLFAAFYAVRDLNPEDPARKYARDRLFEAVYRETRKLGKEIAHRQAPRGIAMSSATQIGEDMAANVWNKRGITQLAEQYDPDQASFRTWMTRVLTNEFNDWTRNRGRAAEDEFPEIDPKPLEGHAAAWTHPIGLVTQLFGQEMNQAVANLKLELKEVVALRVYENLTVEETAERLGISPATVKRRQKDAYDLLREVLGGH